MDQSWTIYMRESLYPPILFGQKKVWTHFRIVELSTFSYVYCNIVYVQTNYDMTQTQIWMDSFYLDIFKKLQLRRVVSDFQ